MLIDEELRFLTKPERLVHMMFYLQRVKSTSVPELEQRYGRCKTVIYDDLNVLESVFNVPFVERTYKCVKVLDDWSLYDKYSN